MTKSFDVECPYTGSSQRLQVDFSEVKSIGTLQTSYRKMSYDCPLSAQCPNDYKDQYGRCPAYLSIPDVIHN